MNRLDTGVPGSTIRILLENGACIEFHGPADITKENTDAIVNAANSSLLGGGGVDGAIHRAGGPAIVSECRIIASRIGSLLAGKAVITTGGLLAARHVIHTVGPIYRAGSHDEAEALASCHRESILLADRHSLKSVSFPAISTGAYGYPLSLAAPIAVSAALSALSEVHHVSKIRFVLFDVTTFKAYVRAAEELSTSQNTPFRIERLNS